MTVLADRFKFRVWLVDEKQYHRPYMGFKTDERWINLLPTAEIVCGAIGCDEADDPDDWGPLEVEQCTGLKDKNGKLIFEGDILTRSWDFTTLHGTPCKGTQIAKVIFDEGSACWETEDSDGNGDALWEVREGSEVIGNIQENPELLTEKDKGQ